MHPLIGFAGLSFSLISGSVGIKLSYDRAYNLVYPSHNPISQTAGSVGIDGLRAVEFQTPDNLTLKG